MATIAELEAFVEQVRGGAHSAEDFTRLLTRGIALLNLTDKELAREFGASRPTVTRWRNGDNAPHPAMRKPVFDFLALRSQILIRRLRVASQQVQAAPQRVVEPV